METKGCFRAFIKKTSPVECDGTFKHYTTTAYKLHFFETPTGIKFVLLSEPKVDSLVEELKKLYSLYVDYVVKNPLYALGDPIECQLFVDNVDSFIKKISKR